MILFDTHILIWALLGQGSVGVRARSTIERSMLRGDAAVSAVTFLEAATLQRRERVTLPSEVSVWRGTLLRDGLKEIPVDGDIAVRAGLLADFHGDPIDRTIVATAIQGHTLVTADARILRWPGDVSRLDARR